MTLSNLMQFQCMRPSKNCKNRKKQSVISEGLYLTLCLFIKPEVAAKTRTMPATQLCVVTNLWPGSGLFLPLSSRFLTFIPLSEHACCSCFLLSRFLSLSPLRSHLYTLSQNQGHLMLRDAMSLFFTTATCPVQSDGCPQLTNLSQIQKKASLLFPSNTSHVHCKSPPGSTKLVQDI